MLRRGLVTIVLLGLLLAAASLVTWRALEMKTTLMPDVATDQPEKASHDEDEMSAGPVLHVPAPPPDRQPVRRVLDRPLAVACAGWALAAPALVANAGNAPNRGSAFAPSGLDVSISIADSLDPLVEGLILGGGDAKGADLAILPLPQWVSVQDRLDTIDPVVFFVAGWSHGREAVLDWGGDPDLRPIRVGFDGVDAAYLALFGLDAQGVPPREIQLVANDAEPAPKWLATSRTGPSALGLRPVIRWTTAEASGLIPIVMVASRRWVESHESALSTWLRGWMFGVGEMMGRLPEATRRLGAMDGAPTTLELVRGVEAWEPCSLKTNLALFELDGPSIRPLAAVMRQTWGLLHQARLASPVPRTLPISSLAVEAMLHKGGRSATNTAWSRWTRRPEPAAGERVVLARPLGDVDGHGLADQIATLASVFPGCSLRVTPKEKKGPIQQAFALARQLAPVTQSVVLAAPNPDLSTAGTLEVLLTP